MSDVADDPTGYTGPSMDQEMNFPNPVARTDLPTRRRRWPKVVLVLGVLGLLAIVFLPQILSSKVGRKFVVSYIAGKTNSTVTLAKFQTSWFGGTSVQFLSISDPMGRRMGFKSLTCKASLWNLLRGKYKLGETVVDGLNIDYVIDDGRGGDSFDRMKGPPGEGGTVASNRLPDLSGRITINTGTITLFRGTVQPRLYNVTWEQAKLENLEATFDIAALDKPWTYTFAADTIEENHPRGTVTSTGAVDLGENGRTDAKGLKLDLSFTGENVRTGALGAALIPAALPQDAREALGPVLKRIDLAVKAANGRLSFERCDISGYEAEIHLKPTIDLTATPATLNIAGEAGKISIGVSKRFASAWLVYLNPFFGEAAGGEGNVTLTVEQLTLPLGNKWAQALTAKGRLNAREVILNREDEMSANQTLPDNLASQLALLTGDSDKAVALTADGEFSVSGGEVVVPAMATTMGHTKLMLQGSTELEGGSIKMSATLIGAPGSLNWLAPSFSAAPGGAGMVIPISGTIRQPQLGIFNLKGDLPDGALKSINEQINQQITRMRSREIQRLMQKSQNQVKEILRPLQGPATAPGSK